MNIKDIDITVSESLLQRLQTAKAAVEENLDNFTDKAQHVSDDWRQTAIEGTQNLPHQALQNAVNTSVTDWFEHHPEFLNILKFFHWAVNHPIISLIIIVFTLAIFWSLIKAIGRLIESASLSILRIPLNLFQAFIKYIWLSLGKLTIFATQQKTVNNNSKYQIQNITAAQIVSYNKQQRLKDISTRLEEIQNEQQQLLQEAADILEEELGVKS